MTCHNRRDNTLLCLKRLYEQEYSTNISLIVYLVDDGSSDGTYEAVQTLYPEVVLLQGTGNLYWNGGMRLAFSEAMKKNYDYYLWLNDDVKLVPEAIGKLLETYDHLSYKGFTYSIVVGSTYAPQTSELSYGGVVRKSRCYAFGFKWIEPGSEPLQCATMNGNCVLIPRQVANRVGNLDSLYTHSLGDFDYGLRAGKKSCSVWVAPFYVGSCPRNEICGTWLDTNISVKKRINKVRSPKGRIPRETFIFAKRYGGRLWFFYWLGLYRHLFPGF